MNDLIYWINSLVGFAFGLMHAPLEALSPFWSLTMVSLLTAVFFLLLYPFFSNQEEIKRRRAQVSANLLAVRLFQDHLGVFFRTQGRILKHTGRYMSCALPALLIMLIPIILILIQLNLHYAVRPMQPGETVLLKARATEDLIAGRALSLQVPDGVTVETPGVFIPARGEVAWRLRADEIGDYRLRIEAGGQTVEKRLQVGEASAVAPLRSAKFLDVLLYAGEAPLASSPGVHSIQILYPERIIAIGGWPMSWIIQFTVLTILFGFLLKDLFGVEI